MTEKEAIEELKNKYRKMSMCYDLAECKKHNQAISKAIRALEEIPVYRAVAGTPEELKQLVAECNDVIKEARVGAKKLAKYQVLEQKLNGIPVELVVTIFIATAEGMSLEGYERGRILTNEDADKWEAYKEIGTIDEFKALKEKETPKKPIPNKPLKRGEYIGWHCPMCNKERWSGFFYPPLRFNERCPKCGHVIDWNFREYET